MGTRKADIGFCDECGREEYAEDYEWESHKGKIFCDKECKKHYIKESIDKVSTN